jgi:hypothetical protein
MKRLIREYINLREVYQLRNEKKHIDHTRTAKSICSFSALSR